MCVQTAVRMVGGAIKDACKTYDDAARYDVIDMYAVKVIKVAVNLLELWAKLLCKPDIIEKL